MATSGWKQLLVGRPWFQGAGNFPIAAYSEFVPPPRLGCWPYRSGDPVPFAKINPFGWNVTEYEEDYELRPGLEHIANQVVQALVRLGRGQPVRGLARNKLADNPYWPPDLEKRAGSLVAERYVTLLPLALSRSQDDKGRLRWTLFGGSEQGPARAFWKGFFTAPGQEVAEEQALDFFRRLLGAVYGETPQKQGDLRRAGFRILPQGKDVPFAYWSEEPLPSWTERFLFTKGQPVGAVKYLLTFRPFSMLPAAIQQAYLSGDLNLLPFPGSLVFWGIPFHLRLQREFPLAMQVPLLEVVSRKEDPHGIRIPQAGWFDMGLQGELAVHEQAGEVKDTYKRSHRFARVHRHEDEVSVLSREEKITNVLFSTAPEHMGLYGKPMARNAQVWTEEGHLLLDGPVSSSTELAESLVALAKGGRFGYRFQFPAMRVGPYEVYWHRPLVAYWSGNPRSKKAAGQAVVVQDAPLGYLTAYKADRPALDRPIELWPRLLQREPHLAALQLFDHAHNFNDFRNSLNIRKLLNTRQLFGQQPLPRTFARKLLTAAKQDTLEGWLNTLPQRASDKERAERLKEEVERCLEPPAPEGSKPQLPESLTYGTTAKRSFEVAYWKTIVFLAEGDFVNKVNSDCISDPITQKLLNHHARDLEAVGDYLIKYYQRKIAAAGLERKALVGEMPFKWQTDFDFSWSAGWVNNQEGRAYERNIMVVIPGRDRSRAVIMGDHYDTAYMADHYEPEYGGVGARLAAAGADDNHSATVALMLAAPIFLKMSKAGQLDCDIWLVHLTGEEFPSDCLGARNLCQRLVEGSLTMHVAGGGKRDLSKVQVQGVYVLDMVAHNNDNDQDVFQISPGTGRQSNWLAYQAHLANEIWNAAVPSWNKRSDRLGRPRGRRSLDPELVPDVAAFPVLHGEVRPPYDPRSTLYNTDGQIFSDAGVPVVLFMENYDIHRDGYHDSHDTMENIDLDYGAALTAITIEAVARAATEKPPS